MKKPKKRSASLLTTVRRHSQRIMTWCSRRSLCSYQTEAKTKKPRASLKKTLPLSLCRITTNSGRRQVSLSRLSLLRAFGAKTKLVRDSSVILATLYPLRKRASLLNAAYLALLKNRRQMQILLFSLKKPLKQQWSGLLICHWTGKISCRHPVMRLKHSLLHGLAHQRLLQQAL